MATEINCYSDLYKLLEDGVINDDITIRQDIKEFDCVKQGVGGVGRHIVSNLFVY